MMRMNTIFKVKMCMLLYFELCLVSYWFLCSSVGKHIQRYHGFEVVYVILYRVGVTSPIHINCP
jgi:hypothetical protein